MATYCKVRLYETVGGRYIDLSDQIQGPTLKYVENYGVTGTINVINDLDSPSRNLLSSSCSKWSTGTGAIRTGMFLYIYKGSISSSTQLGIFIITDLSVSDDVISLTFGDAIQILRATGGEYVRNHYLAGSFDWNEGPGAFDSFGNLYLNKESYAMVHGGSYRDARWRENLSLSIASGSEEIKTRTGGDYLEFTIPSTGEYLRAITFSYCKRPTGGGGTGSLNVKIAISVGGSQISSVNQDVTWTAFQERTFSLLVNGIPRDSGPVTVRMTINSNYEAWIVVKTGDAPSSSYSINEDGVTTIGKCAVGTLDYCQTTYNVEGAEDPNDKTHWIISSINGSSSFDSSTILPAWGERGGLWFKDEDQGVSMSTIFDNIVRGAGYTPSVITSTRIVGIFRCNGSYYHDYLLALADMTEPSGAYSGRQHGIAASETSWGSISLGYRYKASDSAVATLYYGGDSSPGSGAIVMMKFSPSLTMKYRPYMAVAKGTKDDGTPIYVTLRDPTVAIGSCATSVDGSVTTMEDAALAAYSNIVTNRSKDWEGTVELSGIYTQLMVAGTFVGGVPVRIYDSRYGMSGYAAKVKEVMLDFTNQTTKLYLNNYSEMYANSVLDSSKMAYSAGEMSVEASSKDMFVRQYVFLDQSSVSLPSATPIVQAYVGDSWVTADSSDVIRFPEIGVALVSGYFEQGNGETTIQYGVTTIRVSGVSVSIPTYKRPDKTSSQSLIVNILYKIS